jgi:hypothetical protein
MNGPAAIVDQGILNGQPITAISYLEPEHSWDSGFALFSHTPDSSDRGELIHLDCLLDQHPEIGKGLDVARRHGEAIYAGASWVPSNG